MADSRMLMAERHLKVTLDACSLEETAIHLLLRRLGGFATSAYILPGDGLRAQGEWHAQNLTTSLSEETARRLLSVSAK